MTKTELSNNALVELIKVQTDIAWLAHKRLLLIPYLSLATGSKAQLFIVSQIEGLDRELAALYAMLSSINSPLNLYYIGDTYAS
jgi:hypothetical protein